MPRTDPNPIPKPIPANPRAANAHLRRVDPALGRAIDRVGPFRMRTDPPTLAQLCSAIIGQQLSIKVADVICRRFEDCHGAGEALTVEHLDVLEDAQLRAAGLSFAKIRTVRGLARFWADNRLSPTSFDHLHDQAIIDLLTQVKGIGPWTAKMFLMFNLRRPDVLPQEDLGIRAAIQRIDTMELMPSPREVVERCREWSPWSTVASWYCWQSLKL